MWLETNSVTVFDQSMKAKPFLASLLKADELAKGMARPNMRIRMVNDFSGENARFSLRVSVPRGYGVNYRTGSLDELQTPYREHQSTVTLLASPSHYSNDDTIREADLEVYTATSSPQIADVIDNKMVGLFDGLADAINDDLFSPTANISPSNNSATGDTGAPSEGRIMAVGHPFQTGQLGNAAGNSTSYMYYGYDIGVNSDSQAVNLGTYASATTVATATIFESILGPLHERGSRPDIALCPLAFYVKLKELMEAKVVLGNVDSLIYGIESIVIDGVRYIVEPNMTRAHSAGAKPEVYYFNSKWWDFGVKSEVSERGSVIGKGMFRVSQPTNSNMFKNILGGLTVRLVCTNVRHQGHFFNPNV